MMTNVTPAVSPYVTGLGLRCPRCGKGHLFASYLKLNASCSECGLEFEKADAGDGPAVFAIFIGGFVSVAIAFIARFVWLAPMWVSFAIAVVFTSGLLFVVLPPLKSLLISLQYANKAVDGRRD